MVNATTTTQTGAATMSVQSHHRIDYGAFCIWKYNGPSKRARGFWHEQNNIDKPMWAFALRSRDGSFWETSRAKGGFADEESAINAARAVVADREVANG